MRILAIILIIAGVGFLAYAAFKEYPNTPTDESNWKRMWLAIVAAASGLTAAALSLIHGWTAP